MDYYNNSLITYTLNNGLRVVHIRRDSLAEYCGVAIRAGSRDELPGEEGLAHFVEHTIFKGTSNRPASRIINRMETIGGELNAYTTKEETYVYTVFPTGYFSRGIEMIADLAINSIFPDDELDKEREVVAEEIDSYLDMPSEAVFDDFEDLIFHSTTLGHNILGTTATLATFDSRKCRSFVERYYHAPNMVFFYLGNAPERAVRMVANRYFAPLPTSDVVRTSSPLPIDQHFDRRRGRDSNHQAHCVDGALMPSIYSPDRHAIALLNNILGGPGMNSRLNVALRERRGLVYSVESSASLMSDTGLLSIYYGCNPEDAMRCRRLVMRELEKMQSKPLTQKGLDAARRQYLGQVTVASSSAEQLILSAARQMLFFGEVATTQLLRRRLEAITTDDMARCAQYFAPDRFSSLTLG